MKNHEEFKAAVFQKAERFEARRKARNKKILETAGLCSFALVITLSAYLGLFPSLHNDVPETAGTKQTSVSTENATTHTTGTTLENTFSTPIETTTAQSSTSLEYTLTETTTSLTDTTMATIVESTTMPPISVLEFRASAKDSDFAVGKTEILEIGDYEKWCDFLDKHTDDYPTLEENAALLHTITEEYFEEHTLIIIQYAGYDIVAFGSDMPQNTEDTDEAYTFYIDLRENRTNTRKQIHIMSVEKDVYDSTKIRVWNEN